MGDSARHRRGRNEPLRRQRARQVEGRDALQEAREWPVPAGEPLHPVLFRRHRDTNALTEAGSAFGGFGAIFRLTQSSPSANAGSLALFYRGDVAHTGLDNVAFWDCNHVVFVEDAGDGVHSQRNAFDSAYLFDVRSDDSHGAQPDRMIALGRDASATLDSGLSAAGNGFPNEGDNEITGIHVSDGDPSVHGILGAQSPHPFRQGWRVFYTQQHGDNVTWEILRAGAGPRGLDDDSD